MPRLESNLKKILTIGLYLAPLTLFVFWQGTVFPFIALKTYILAILAAQMFVAWLILILFFPAYRVKKSWVSASFIIFMLLLTISGLLGFNQHRSFWTTPDRGIGIFTLWHFAVLTIILFSLGRQFNWPRYWRYLFWVGLGVAITGLIEIINSRLFLVDYNISRPGSTIGNPAYFASYLIFVIFIGAWLILQAWQKKKWFLLAILSAAALFQISMLPISGTRGALLGLGAGIFILLIFWAKPVFQKPLSRQKFFHSPAALILAAGIALGILVLATPSLSIWQKVPGLNRLVSTSTQDSSVSNRLIAWNIALDAFLEKPVLGWGYDNFRYAFGARYDPRLLRGGFTETYWDKTHNIFLEMLATGGMLGLISFLALVGTIIYALWRHGRTLQFVNAGLALVAAYLVQGFFIFDTFGSYLMFFIFAAFAYHLEVVNQHATKNTLTPRSPLRLTKIGVLTLGGIVSAMTIFVYSKSIYANHIQWTAMNHYVNYRLDEALTNFKKLVRINQPYQRYAREQFLSSVAQVAQVAQPTPLPNPFAHINPALIEYQKVIAADPGNYLFYTALADAKATFARFDAKYLEGAETLVRKAQEISPHRQQNHYVLARIRMMEGDYPAAQEEMQKAVALDPAVAKPHYYYGILAFENGDFKTGLAEIQMAMELGFHTYDADQWLALGNYFSDAGNLEDAEYFYEQAYISRYSDPEIEAKLALVKFYNDKPDEARLHFRQALQKLPNSWWQSESREDLRPVLDTLGIYGPESLYKRL